MGVRAGDDLLDGVRKTLGSLGEPTASAHVSVLATGTQNESGAPGSSRQIKGEATSMFIVPQGAERQVLSQVPFRVHGDMIDVGSLGRPVDGDQMGVTSYARVCPRVSTLLEICPIGVCCKLVDLLWWTAMSLCATHMVSHPTSVHVCVQKAHNLFSLPDCPLVCVITTDWRLPISNTYRQALI